MRGPQSKLKAKPTVAGCLTKRTKRTAWDLVIVRPCSMTPVHQNLLDAKLGSTTFKKYATSSRQKLSIWTWARATTSRFAVVRSRPLTRRGVAIWICETGMCSLSTKPARPDRHASQKLQTALKPASPRPDLEVHTSVLYLSPPPC